MGESIRRRNARQEKLESALACMPRRISKANRELWFKMTPKQRSLATLLAQGQSRSAAFRLAYGRSADDTRPSTYTLAWKAATNEKVMSMAEALVGHFDEQGLSDAITTRQYVLEKLLELSHDEAVPSSVQLAATAWLGRTNHVRLFADENRKEPEPIDDARTALKEAIAELFAPKIQTASSVIDVQAKSGDSEPDTRDV
jgi:hypothetical protein